MEIYVGSQIPYSDRDDVSRALGWPEERVRVIGQLMGGGFGGKEDIAGQVHAALLANVTGRPVKLLFDRHESLIVHPKRHATQIRVKLGAKKDGTLVAAQTELYGDTGAYASLGEKVLTRATTHSAGPYEVTNVRADCYAMYTNNPPAGAFRGFGVLQSAFAFETMMDMLAEKLGLDRVELRRMNALRVGDETSTGQVMRESAGLVECIDKVEARMLEVSGLNKPDLFKPRRVEAAEHLVRAWGFASAFKNTGLGGGADDTSGAEVELYEDGTLQVRSAAAELGQGLVTIMQMMVAEEFSLPSSRVRVLVMDTDLTPNGDPTTASRQTYVTGNASRLAAKTLREAIAATMAEKYDLSPEKIRFSEKGVHVNGYVIPLGQVAAEMRASGNTPRVLYEYHAPATKPLGQGGDMHVAFSFASQAAEVEVNTLTGEVRVIRVISANDVGRAINPLGLQGQVEGGVVMGVGHALLENFITKDGYVVTDRMARYRIPSIMHTPEIISIIVEDPTKEGPYGAKGVGEIVKSLRGVLPVCGRFLIFRGHARSIHPNQMSPSRHRARHEAGRQSRSAAASLSDRPPAKQIAGRPVKPLPRSLLWVVTLLVPVLFFLLLELSLRLFHYGGNTGLFEPWEWKGKKYLKMNEGVVNRYFSTQGFTTYVSRDVFLAEKPAGVYRIF